MTSVTVGREPSPVRVIASGIAAYEVAALWTNLPTITRLTRLCPPLGALILIGLTVHFYPPRRPQP